MVDFFITDGQDERGYIAESPRLHPALGFTFRPILVEERDTIERARGAKSGVADAHAVIRRAMAKHVKTWDAPAPITDEHLRKLRPALFDKLWAILAGDRGSDLRPGESDKAVADQLDVELEALGLGASPADVKLASELKNSGGVSG